MLGFVAAMLGMSVGVPSKAISEPRTPTQMLAEGLDKKAKKKDPPVKLGPDPCPDRLQRAVEKRERRSRKRYQWLCAYEATYYRAGDLLA